MQSLSTSSCLEPASLKRVIFIVLTNIAPEGHTPMGLQRSNTVMYARLLSEQEINKVKDKFNEDIDFVLDEAIRKHHNV